MVLTPERVKKIFCDEVDALFDGRPVLKMDRGSLAVTLNVENGEVKSKNREKEIENVHKNK